MDPRWEEEQKLLNELTGIGFEFDHAGHVINAASGDVRLAAKVILAADTPHATWGDVVEATGLDEKKIRRIMGEAGAVPRGEVYANKTGAAA